MLWKVNETRRFNGLDGLNTKEKTSEKNEFSEHTILYHISHLTSIFEFEKIVYVKLNKIALQSIQIAFHTIFWIKRLTSAT